MRIESVDIEGIFELIPERHDDARGWLMEVYRSDLLAAAGIVADFVQENHIFSAERGTVRGLHFQASPRPQAKLARCTRGAVFDVAVDLRRGSSTFGRHVAIELTAEEGHSLFIPSGFAHGFCSLAASSEVLLRSSDYHVPDCAGGVLWCDPGLDISWPVTLEDATVSHRDRQWPLLTELGDGLPENLTPRPPI